MKTAVRAAWLLAALVLAAPGFGQQAPDSPPAGDAGNAGNATGPDTGPARADAPAPAPPLASLQSWKLHPRGFLDHYRQIWRQLDLASDQKEQLFKLQQRFKKRLFALEQLREQEHFDLQRELIRTQLDDAKLAKVSDAIAANRRQMIQTQIDFVKELHQILTAAQLSKLQELLH